MSLADEFDVVKLRHGGEWGCVACPVEAAANVVHEELAANGNVAQGMEQSK